MRGRLGRSAAPSTFRERPRASTALLRCSVNIRVNCCASSATRMVKSTCSSTRGWSQQPRRLRGT